MEFLQRLLPAPLSQPISGDDSCDTYLKSANLYIKTFEEIRIKFIRCYIEDCDEKVLFKCKCLSHAIFVCQTHVGAHLIKDISPNKQNSNINSKKNHAPRVLNPEIYDQEWDEVAYYLHNYCTDIKKLKKNIISKVIDHFEKINNDVYLLFTRIDAILSNINLKILDLANTNLKIIKKLAQFDPDYIKEFTNKCEKIEISDECFDIILAEIENWNATMINNKIAKIPTIANKLGRKLLKVNDWNESVEITAFIRRISEKLTKPILHWCQWQSNKVHYFDCYNNTHKSITIDGLKILKWSRSISIDHNNILLCGGWPDDITPKTNENTFKINLQTQSFKTLAYMNTGRTGFSITHLNGFYYVLGGADYQKYRLKKCERYLLDNPRWEDIADLNHPRYDATCVSISDEKCIYIIGGRVNHGKLDETIEKYESESNHWNPIRIQKPIMSKLLGCCILPHSNLILIFGGEDSNNKYQKESYLFNYKNNQVANTNPMSSDNNSVVNKPVILNNKVYCYFWKSNKSRELSIYDIKSGIWSVNP